MPTATPTGSSLPQPRNVCTRSKRNIQPGTKGEISMDAQDIIELIEYQKTTK